jgi:hypothetical protein
MSTPLILIMSQRCACAEFRGGPPSPVAQDDLVGRR